MRPGAVLHLPPRTQPKVPEAKVRGSQESFQWGLVSLERVPGVREGARGGPLASPRPLEALHYQPWQVPELGADELAAERPRGDRQHQLARPQRRGHLHLGW